MQTLTVFYGIDVGKHELVIARSDQTQTQTQTIANHRKAIRDWLKTVPADAAIGVESTGRHHCVLVRLAQRLRVTVFVLDARRTQAYARALGHRGKTDLTDARSIAHFLATSHAQLRPCVLPTLNQRRVDTLLRRRGKLVTARTQFVQMARALPVFGAQLRALAAQLGQLVKQITRQMASISCQDPTQADLVRRLDAVPSFGDVTAIGLANLFRRVPLDTADRAVAFVGLDPRPCDSATRRGRRKLTKHGPAELRRLLYLAAMSARRLELWKPFYEHDRKRGLQTTEALVILARRLLRTAWAIAYRGGEFDPRRVGVAGSPP